MQCGRQRRQSETGSQVHASFSLICARVGARTPGGGVGGGGVLAPWLSVSTEWSDCAVTAGGGWVPSEPCSPDDTRAFPVFFWIRTWARRSGIRKRENDKRARAKWRFFNPALGERSEKCYAGRASISAGKENHRFCWKI